MMTLAYEDDLNDGRFVTLTRIFLAFVIDLNYETGSCRNSCICTV